MLKIAFTGGGTGGHIYPALAVIFALREIAELDILWIGQKHGMDRKIVESAGIRFYGIHTGKLRRYFSLHNIADIFNIIAGYFESITILKKEKPALLFSKGGFVSVPPLLAAASRGIITHTHESDFSPGLATKINARFASLIWTAYEKTAMFFKPALRQKIRCSGNPVRKAFYTANAERGRQYIETASGKSIPHDTKILFVLGGSQGAKEVNDLVTTILAELTQWFFIVHQTGAGGSQNTTAYSDAVTARYFPVAYIHDEMPDVLAASSLVLGRSGAGTVWESAAAGIPMLLVPLAGAGTRGDQVENARYFAQTGAACMLVHPQPQELLSLVAELAADNKRIEAMAAASKKIGERDAANIIAKEIMVSLEQQS